MRKANHTPSTAAVREDSSVSSVSARWASPTSRATASTSRPATCLKNDKAFLFLMDYAYRRRVKIWGRARVSEDPEGIDVLMPEGYRARPEQAILFDVEAWDVNCRQHIPQKIDAEDVARALESLQERIARLEEENAALKSAASARA
jgi:hypothetical protein